LKKNLQKKILRACLGRFRHENQGFAVLAKLLNSSFTAWLLRGGGPNEYFAAKSGS
jgi:hypothetical protein